ncbi:hypothetical protein C8Q79DRAFT_963606 [Trametes meyenii]|nr:hypothetical protein C8Q79DRAFT_963606 [Trametes meyenii]
MASVASLHASRGHASTTLLRSGDAGALRYVRSPQAPSHRSRVARAYMYASALGASIA